MKTFETPVIEVIAFTTESIMDVSNGDGANPSLPRDENDMPWG